MWWNDCDSKGYFYVSHGIWWVFWLAILIIAYLMLKAYLDNKKEKDSSLKILKRKYALGEISTEEYEERKRVLEDK